MTRLHRNELIDLVSMSLICLTVFVFGATGLSGLQPEATLIQTKLACWLSVSMFWIGSAYFCLTARDIAREAMLVRG